MCHSCLTSSPDVYCKPFPHCGSWPRQLCPAASGTRGPLTTRNRSHLRSKNVLNPLRTNEPIYVNMILKLLKADLRPSYKYPGCRQIILNALPASLELGCWAPDRTGNRHSPRQPAAVRHGTPRDRTHGGRDDRHLSALICDWADPALAFSLHLGWFNPLGWNYASDRVLPALTLGSCMRRSASGAQWHDGCTAQRLHPHCCARASERVVILRHALRTALYPVVAYIGPAAAGLISGSFVVESIFFIPGLGLLRQRSTQPGLSDGHGYGAVLCDTRYHLNLVVDLIQMWMNPRTRHD